MVLMALDHARDYFSESRFDPTDPERTNVALFATRWVTHFCAPVFILLAGTGAYFQLAGGKSRGTLARFLLTRGLWLVALELTAVHWGWEFRLGPVFGLQVMWAIGWSMVLLAGLVFLPPAWIGLIGVTIVVLHDLADGVHASAFGALAPLWHLVHEPAPVALGPVGFWVAYPLVPWVGVMAAGFGLGPLIAGDPAIRRARLVRIGAALVVGFLALRAVNIYGDIAPWVHEPSATETAMSFFRVSKYPPSLDYVMATLGPALLALAWLDTVADSPAVRPLLVFGRVPPSSTCCMYLSFTARPSSLGICVTGRCRRPSSMAPSGASRRATACLSRGCTSCGSWLSSPSTRRALWFCRREAQEP